MVTPLTDEDGTLIGFTKVARDITAAKEAEEMLKKHAEALKEEHLRKDHFLAMLAHELRNPLAAISSTVRLFRFRDLAEPDLAWGREVIDRQVTQLTRLIDDLLDVSRISTGKIQLRRQILDLRETIDLVVESSRALIESKQHELAVSLPDSTIRVEGDPVRLQQAIGNLVTNAAKYTDEGGRIVVSATLEGPTVAISVRDNGLGIPAEMLPEVFGLFTQVDSSLGRSQGGLGIGLSLVKTLVDMHGGSVAAASGGPGQGSEFTIRLPVLAEPPGPSAGAKPEEGRGSQPAGRPRRQRILVVDDSEDTARGMARFLKLSGHEVRVALDGPSALIVAREFLPGIVLLDIGLPGMTGYELARMLRGEAGLAGATLIAVSGYGQEKDRDDALGSGFDHHMIKPLDVDRLLEFIARL
jgi:CheY-like chemotaxis protein